MIYVVDLICWRSKEKRRTCNDGYFYAGLRVREFLHVAWQRKRVVHLAPFHMDNVVD